MVGMVGGGPGQAVMVVETWLPALCTHNVQLCLFTGEGRRTVLLQGGYS